MERIGKSFLCLVTIGVIGMFASSSAIGATEGESSSSACIACHTDLEAMDNYGAASAKDGAGIAG